MRKFPVLILFFVFVPLIVLADAFPFGGSSETFGAGILKINNLSSFPDEKFFIRCPLDTERRVYSDTLIVMCEGVGDKGGRINLKIQGKNGRYVFQDVSANTYKEITIENVIDDQVFTTSADLPADIVKKYCPDAKIYNAKKHLRNTRLLWLGYLSISSIAIMIIVLVLLRRSKRKAS